MRLKLTDLTIRQLPFTPSGQQTYWDVTTPAFGLRVGTRSKSFVVMYGQKRKLKTLGRYPDISLADARLAAKRVLVSKPASPEVEISYDDARKAFIEECRDKNRPKTVVGYERYLKTLKYSGKVSDLNRQTLKPVLSSPHKLTAFKIFLNWCVRNEYLLRNPLLGDKASYNPSRDRVLSVEELKAVWHYECPPFSDIVKLLVLLGQRRTETSLIVSDWIDGDIIYFPPEVTKNKKAHAIPFGPLAARYLPPEPFNGWSKSKRAMDKAVKIDPWTLHDLRRTFSSNHAPLGTPIHVVEKLLNHSSGSFGGVAGIYNRYGYMEEMRQAVQRYEDWLSSTLSIGG
ncbi:tyrosine-type recombinase/integrase [Hoeflea poritis]|uniref:Site-specific integrase n=1 Tax=Hoeflea poritis TaxID=2993659 RepID=A0ABT4VP07_9HYPH|nr:site-specific integrase [Hoeflea poritis]MDA4846419.1 site-specific integrase [Hoeflea poritis]